MTEKEKYLQSKIDLLWQLYCAATEELNALRFVALQLVPDKSLEDVLDTYRKDIREQGNVQRALDAFRKKLDQYDQAPPSEAREMLERWNPKNPFVN